MTLRISPNVRQGRFFLFYCGLFAFCFCLLYTAHFFLVRGFSFLAWRGCDPLVPSPFSFLPDAPLSVDGGVKIPKYQTDSGVLSGPCPFFIFICCSLSLAFPFLVHGFRLETPNSLSIVVVVLGTSPIQSLTFCPNANVFPLCSGVLGLERSGQVVAFFWFRSLKNPNPWYRWSWCLTPSRVVAPPASDAAVGWKFGFSSKRRTVPPSLWVRGRALPATHPF